MIEADTKAGVTAGQRRIADLFDTERRDDVRSETVRLSIGVFMLVVAFSVPAPVAWCAQRVVLLEKFSATWCPHCMVASQATDRLVEDFSSQFIPLDVFASTDGRYSHPWGLSRAFTFYDLASYPTAWFDGVVERVGSVDTYSSYLSSLTSRSSTPTDLNIDLTATHLGGRKYDLTLSVGLEAGASARTVQLYLVEAIDHYGYYDDLTTVPRNTLWQVLTSGLDMTLDAGQSRQLKTSVTLDSVSWARFADVRFIAWAQAPAQAAPAEIYNAAQISLPPLVTGDFSQNGVVDAADYVAWRNGQGAAYTQADYDAWRAHFGQATGASIGVNVPVAEPATFAMFVFAAACGCGVRLKTSPCADFRRRDN
jgi:hypothetical protein